MKERLKNIINPFSSSPEVEVVMTGARCLSMVALFYMSILVGIEAEGRTKGYKGKGMETHDEIMRAIKAIFFGKK